MIFTFYTHYHSIIDSFQLGIFEKEIFSLKYSTSTVNSIISQYYRRDIMEYII